MYSFSHINKLIVEIDSSKLQNMFSECKGERHLHWSGHLAHGIECIWWHSFTDVKEEHVE